VSATNQTSKSSFTSPGNLVKTRPAETTAAASAIALLVCKLLGVDDPDVLVALGIVIGFIPAAVTWIVVLIRGKTE
jgi:hypothetical protein